MKKSFKSALSCLLCAILLLTLAACAGGVEKKGLWKDADYCKDTTFGKGEKTVQVEVKAEEQSVTFTIKTDKEMLGDALTEHKLIEGDMGDYGLYINIVNGITADYNANGSYWAIYQNGEYLLTSVDTTAIKGGEHFELVYEIYTPTEQ